MGTQTNLGKPAKAGKPEKPGKPAVTVPTATAGKCGCGVDNRHVRCELSDDLYEYTDLSFSGQKKTEKSKKPYKWLSLTINGKRYEFYSRNVLTEVTDELEIPVQGKLLVENSRFVSFDAIV